MRLSWPSLQLNNHSTIQLHGIALIAGLLPKSPSHFPWKLSACLTSLTVFLPQSHNRSCYGNRRTLAPPPLWLHKPPDLPAYQFTHSKNLWHPSEQPTFPVPEAGDFVELILLYTFMLPSHIQCEYQNNHKKLHLQRLMLIFTPCLYLSLFRQMLGSAFK